MVIILLVVTVDQGGSLHVTCSAYIGPWWPVKAAVILS